MRGAHVVALLFVGLSAGCSIFSGDGSTPEQPAAEPVKPVKPIGPPAWIPPYSPQQQVLLAPVERAVQVRAARVFPDLERFGYADDRPLASVEDARAFTKMVTTILHDSPRFYSLGEAPAGTDNPVVQYGPAPTVIDGFAIVRRGEGGIGQLSAAPGAEEARAAAARGGELAEVGDVTGAIDAYRDGITRSPEVPALRLLLGDALAKAKKPAEAEAAYREATRIDATFAPAHLGLAMLAEQRGDLVSARREAVEALAWEPGSRLALDVAERLGPAAKGGAADGGWIERPAALARSSRDEPFAVFLDVDAAGAIRVATGSGDAAQIYGGCRAVMRYEPDLRARIFQQPRETPYYLSVTEEVLCLEAALGAYAAERAERRDPRLDRLLRIALEEGLSGYVMFEILGKRRPERARAAPLPVHHAIVSYVEGQVLAQKQASPEGVFAFRR